MTMRTVYRYVVPVDDQQHQVALTGPIVHVGARAEDSVEFWAVVDTDAEPTDHTFLVIGTGHPFPAGAKSVVGSAVTPSGYLVWHLVELERAS